MVKKGVHMKVGESYKMFFNRGNINNKVIHTVALVDDGVIIYKYYNRCKKRWIYQVDDNGYLAYLKHSGKLIKR